MGIFAKGRESSARHSVEALAGQISASPSRGRLRYGGGRGVSNKDNDRMVMGNDSMDMITAKENEIEMTEEGWIKPNHTRMKPVEMPVRVIWLIANALSDAVKAERFQEIDQFLNQLFFTDGIPTGFLLTIFEIVHPVRGKLSTYWHFAQGMKLFLKVRNSYGYL